MTNRQVAVLALTLVLAMAAVVPAGAQPAEPITKLFLPTVVRGPEGVALNATADAFVFENGPAINTGSEPALYVGNDQDAETQMGIMRSFINFDLPANPPPILAKAILRLFYAGYSDFPHANRTVHVWAVNRPWTESTVTWANQPYPDQVPGEVTINSDAPFGYVEVDVTNMVDSWLHGNSSYGFLVTGPEDASDDWAFRVFGSRESVFPPQLSLTFPD